MIWIALMLVGISFLHWAIRHRRQWGALWLNVAFACMTFVMSLTVSTHAWAESEPIRWLYAVFVPASKLLYNLI